MHQVSAHLTNERVDSHRVKAGIWARDRRKPPNRAAVSTARLPPVLATAVVGAAAPVSEGRKPRYTYNRYHVVYIKYQGNMMLM